MTVLVILLHVVNVVSGHGELVNASYLARDIPISADNPFFNGSKVILAEVRLVRCTHSSLLHILLSRVHCVLCVVQVPESLLFSLLAANCSEAWRRQQHKTSVLDRRCTQMVRPFLFGTAGSVMGMYDGVMNYPIAAVSRGPSMSYFFKRWSVNGPYATVVTEDLVVEGANGDLTADLSSVGWTRRAPALFDPPSGWSRANAFAEERPVGDIGPFTVHEIGAWSFQVAGGGPDASPEANRRALKHSAELWLFMGQHAKQSDVSHRLFVAFGEIVIHGLHGAMWEYTKVVMNRTLPHPSEALWEEFDQACAIAKAVDYALYGGCAHGFGHSLTFYVSSQRATISESLAPCARFEPDSRLVLTCADGFFHELERAGLFLDPAVGQHYLPSGSRAPCDHDGPHYEYLCFLHLKVGATLNRKTAAHANHSWVQTSTLPDGQTTVSALTAIGRRVWSDSIAFCASERLYPSLTKQAACLTSFMEYFREVLLPQLPTGTSTLWDARSFALTPEERVGRMATEVPPPQVRAATLSSLVETLSPEDLGADQPRYVANESLTYMLCEQASVSFWAWLPCCQIHTLANGMRPDIEITAFSAAYDTPGSHGWSQNPWIPIGTGQEDAAAANCTRSYTNETFAPGAEQQVAFGRAICLDRAFSHDFYLLTLQDPVLLAAAYAAFLSTGHLAHAHSKAAGRAAGAELLTLLETGSKFDRSRLAGRSRAFSSASSSASLVPSAW
jgi:hypothetical protein